MIQTRSNSSWVGPRYAVVTQSSSVLYLRILNLEGQPGPTLGPQDAQSSHTVSHRSSVWVFALYSAM